VAQLEFCPYKPNLGSRQEEPLELSCGRSVRPQQGEKERRGRSEPVPLGLRAGLAGSGAGHEGYRAPAGPVPCGSVERQSRVAARGR